MTSHYFQIVRRIFPAIPILMLLVLGCQFITGQGIEPAGGQPAASETPLSPTLTPTTFLPSPTLPATASDVLPTATSGPALPQATPTWPAALPAPGGRIDRMANPAEIAAAERLRLADPPGRDDVQLAVEYAGVRELPTPRPPSTDALTVGTVQELSILNIDNNTVGTVEVALEAVGEHAYFWFDTGAGSIDPDLAELQAVAEEFDRIYGASVTLYGSESNPGIDGDSRIHVVNVSPLAVCQVTLETAGNCGLAGYFSATDALPRVVNPASNEREMFVMNASVFGSQFYLSVLAHEFRHMIEDNYDQGDYDWEVEGSAVLAETLLGYGERAVSRANQFLADPDRQLTNWSDGNSIPSYGQGYLFNRYLYDRLGDADYRRLAVNPARGFDALDELAVQRGQPELYGQQLWLDWLAAIALIGRPDLPEIYRLHDTTLNQAAMFDLARGQKREDTVQQYAVDYYHLTGTGPATLTFSGDSMVAPLDVMPASGDGMWIAARTNYSDMHLTHAFDLRGVSAASLRYDVHHDIELGYDFAYVSVSTDEGMTWRGLEAANMQGLNPSAEDPADVAFTARYYTGQSGGWRAEQIDLSPFAGQEILVRFRYITDPILTFPGIGIDNVAVPEIGFYDAMENAAPGWQAEGFVHTTALIPQEWQLQLITFPGGQAPQVQLLAVNQGRVSLPLDFSQSNGEAILAVAASSPMTLTPAFYEVGLE